MSPVLSAKGVEKRFGAVVAASAINLDIAAGQRVSLIGANGAGKTTFVNMVTGYLRPDAGSIALEGRDVTALSPRSVTRLGICRSFQIPQLCIALTAEENMLVAVSAAAGDRLSFWREAPDGGRQERAGRLLDRFGLAAIAARPVAELPGGVRKLLDIAMALARRPKLLLLDEPTSGVAAEEKFDMMDTILTAVGEEAATILFVEHDMDIVRRYSDRVVAFYAGRVIADGEPAATLDDAEVRRYVTGGLR